ncbi:MAG: NAD(+)/NADH kinase [Candidatus Omnitrophica bacterium]|nr:NAD(+)/NADH kinase [Candidatus Omnitrophota bacterium]
MNSIRKITIVYKESTYSRYFKGKTLKGEVRLLKELHDEHFCMVEKVVSFLRREGIQVMPLKRAQLKRIRNADLVITIGGDGTFLDTAHYVNDIPMWGINSTPTHSAGFLMAAAPENFERRWKLLVGARPFDGAQGEHAVPLLPVLKLQRLQVLINGRKLPELVLNDVLIAHANPAAVSRYGLRVDDRKEEQKSSGLWISTAAGSTAATQSAGGKVLPLESRQIQFIARELYHGRRHHYRLAKGVVSPQTKIAVVSQMHEAGCYLDGPRVWYPIHYGDRVEVKSVNRPLAVIGPIR